jgi:hypothetical protein
MIKFPIPANKGWVMSETILYVFNEKNEYAADYDLYTGLFFELDENNNWFISIEEEDLVPGFWKFSGMYVEENGPISEKRKFVKYEGFKEGETRKRIYKEEFPWDFSSSKLSAVSAKEREERMEICRSCPFFNNEKVSCNKNNDLLHYKTKVAEAFCPEGFWGTFNDKIIFFQSYEVFDDQEDFEKELDEYLKGK